MKKRLSLELWIARLGDAVFIWRQQPHETWLFLIEPVDSIHLGAAKAMFGMIPGRKPMRFLLRRASQ